jgi:hypothetical protein
VSFEDEEGNPVAETTPAQYRIYMSAEGGGGLKIVNGDEETQVYKVYASQVVLEACVAGWREALEEIKEFLEAQIDASGNKVDQKTNQQQQAAP